MPSCQIPWAIFQQICVKWNYTGLPEDVQNQRRGQRMRIIHIIMMNIIHSDTDDNKISECAFFRSRLACLSNVYIIYSLIQSKQPFHLCWVILSGVSFDMVFHSTEYTQMFWLELPSAFMLWFDILTCLTKYFYSSAHICGIIYMSPHTMITQLKNFHSKIVHNCYWYTDYTHCPWINDALVTGHKTSLAYVNYIWLTVTRSLHIYPTLIN